MNCPNGYYCFKVNLFNISVIVIILLIFVLYYYSYRNLSDKIDIKISENKKEDMVNYDFRNNSYNDTQPQIANFQLPQLPPPPELLPINNINDKFLDRIINPLTPPEQTYLNPSIPINIPTRGESEPYQQIGFLVDKRNQSNLMPLFGRQTYPGSSNWNYYTNSIENIKQSLIINNQNCMDNKGCNEVYTGDNIKLQGTKGKYKVEKYNYSQPRYIPF